MLRIRVQSAGGLRYKTVGNKNVNIKTIKSIRNQIVGGRDSKLLSKNIENIEQSLKNKQQTLEPDETSFKHISTILQHIALNSISISKANICLFT